MDIKKTLSKRFTKAIGKSFNRPPLIGPKWFSWHGEAKPPYFQFTGVGKMAKATMTKPDEIVRRLVRHLDTSGLDVEVQATSDGKINVKFNKLPDSD